ncbi:PREDICTED: uncharacterized protein LOC109462392 [Branchiostoma belcheri]|uniref:Uncharacterized protein LOC109462392 n=1 Tax=Branchiostoma belcheri TaxID=7741 RepID=A0A6P4XD65_BRABE|nr:PREDICTED: uncharacterized protein LOC109462392 [Branchiostoma belcheri]
MSQSIRGENNPVYRTNDPEERRSPGQNEDTLCSDEDVLYTEDAAEPTRISTCGPNCPSSEGEDRLEATYVAGDESKRTSENQDYYAADDNDDDVPTPEATEVKSVISDPIAENEGNTDTVGNTDDGPQVMQAVTDDGDMEPYAVANMSDHEAYLSATTNVRQQASDDSRPDTTQHVHRLRNTPSAKELHTNPMYGADIEQDSGDTRNDSDVHQPGNPLNVKKLKGCFAVNGSTTIFPTLVVVMLLVGAITSGVIIGMYENSQGMQADSPMQQVNNLSALNATESTSTLSTITIITESINRPSLKGINDSNPPTTNCKRRANELIVIDDAFYGRKKKDTRCGCSNLWRRFKPCKKCQEVNTSPSAVSPRSRVIRRCQGLQKCDVKVEKGMFGDPCPKRRKHLYLEATYHCEEKKDSVTFGRKGYRPIVGGLAVSLTNEIFVADKSKKRIQVFSMKGRLLRSFSTGNMKPRAVCTGHNNTLWVVLYRGSPSRRSTYENAIQQYSKEGHVLAKFTCKDIIIHGIAWHKLSDRIILSLRVSGSSRVKVAWFSPTYTQESPTCNVHGFGSEGGSLPQSVTVDQNGNIFAADQSNSRVLKYDKSGVYLSSFGSKGSGTGNLYFPSGICVDSSGRVIVADTRNSRVEMFTAEGEHVRTVAYIHRPNHVATGGEGQLVVINDDRFATIFPKY